MAERGQHPLVPAGEKAGRASTGWGNAAAGYDAALPAEPVTGVDIGDGFCWATQAADALMACCGLVDAAVTAGLGVVDPDALAVQVRLLRSAASIGVADNLHRSGKLAAKHRALARRLLNRQHDYLRFTTNFAVPFDNNAAEREIRMIKIRQKVSGCLRTLTGAEQFCAIRSYLATARKHGTYFFEARTMLAEGNAWLPTTTT